MKNQINLFLVFLNLMTFLGAVYAHELATAAAALSGTIGWAVFGIVVFQESEKTK